MQQPAADTLWLSLEKIEVAVIPGNAEPNLYWSIQWKESLEYSEVVFNTQNPTFEAKFDFPFDQKDRDEFVTFHIFNNDPSGETDDIFIGSIHYPLSSVLQPESRVSTNSGWHVISDGPSSGRAFVTNRILNGASSALLLSPTGSSTKGSARGNEPSLVLQREVVTTTTTTMGGLPAVLPRWESLKIRIVKARDLKARVAQDAKSSPSGGLSKFPSTYCYFDWKGAAFWTEVQERSVNPRWDKQFTLPLAKTEDLREKIIVYLMDYDTANDKDRDCMGTAEIDLTNVGVNVPEVKWYQMGGGGAGQLEVVIELKADPLFTEQLEKERMKMGSSSMVDYSQGGSPRTIPPPQSRRISSLVPAFGPSRNFVNLTSSLDGVEEVYDARGSVSPPSDIRVRDSLLGRAAAGKIDGNVVKQRTATEAAEDSRTSTRPPLPPIATTKTTTATTPATSASLLPPPSRTATQQGQQNIQQQEQQPTVPPPLFLQAADPLPASSSSSSSSPSEQQQTQVVTPQEQPAAPPSQSTSSDAHQQVFVDPTTGIQYVLATGGASYSSPPAQTEIQYVTTGMDTAGTTVQQFAIAPPQQSTGVQFVMAPPPAAQFVVQQPPVECTTITGPVMTTMMPHHAPHQAVPPRHYHHHHQPHCAAGRGHHPNLSRPRGTSGDGQYV